MLFSKMMRLWSVLWNFEKDCSYSLFYMNKFNVCHKMLALQLRSAEEASKQQRWSFGETSEPGRDEKLRLIEKEMKEQETLIQGYHLVSLSLLER